MTAKGVKDYDITIWKWYQPDCKAAGETEYESKPAYIHFYHGSHIDRINFFVFVMHIRPKLLEFFLEEQQ